MYWADELAASLAGPQVVNDSKSPSGTVHVGSPARGRAPRRDPPGARARPGLRVHVPLRRRRHGRHGFAGAADARRGRAVHGRAALARARARGQHRGQLRPPFRRRDLLPDLRAARHQARVLLGQRAVRGRPDGPLRQAGARPGGPGSRHLPARQPRRAAQQLAADPGDLRELRQDRDHLRHRLGRRDRRLRVQAGPGRVGSRLRPRRAASRRSAAGPSCPGTWSGPPSGACSASRSRAAARTWPRPAVRAIAPTRSAARSSRSSRRATSPTSSSTSAARRCPRPRARAPPRTRSPRSCRPSSSASSSCGPGPSQVIDFDPEGDTIPRLFDEFDRIAAATAGREVKGELPADHERLFAYSLLGPATGRRRGGAAFRPAFAHLALLLQIPGVDIPARMAAEKGAPLDRARDRGSWPNGRPPPAPGWSRTPPSGPAWPFAATRSRTKSPALDDARRPTLRRSPPPPRTEKPGSGDAWQALIFRVAAASRSLPRAAPSGRCTRPSWAAPTARAPAGCWPASSPRFVVERLKAAAGAIAAA